MMTKETKGTGTASKAGEILIVTSNELGAMAKVTNPLAKNNINIECFTAYEWNGEAAFRFVTNNNKKATELLKNAGYNVQESPVVLWQTTNTTGQLKSITTALAEANINTYCSYSTSLPNSPTTLAVFNTNNPDRTMEVLKRMR